MAKAPPLADRGRNLRDGIYVEWASITWMIIEVLVGVGASLAAGSIALKAFGLDSAIELVSAGVLLWRLRVEASGGNEERVEHAEQRAAGLVGWSLMLLAVYILFNSAWGLWHLEVPESSLPGILLALAALVVMPFLVVTKRRIASRIGSLALRYDADEGVVCAYMAAVLLIGLLLRSVLGWWWADPVAALGIVYFMVREGLEAIEASKGEDHQPSQ